MEAPEGPGVQDDCKSERTLLNLADAIPPLQRLNSWARSDYAGLLDMHTAQQAVYQMKRIAILAAIEAGQCEIRIVSVERSCKTCDGTGMFKRFSRYEEDEWDPEDCRRCNHTGKVTLRFAETKLPGATFHTPRPRADFLAHLKLDWENCESTDWTPEQPGRAMTNWEVIVALNELERALFYPKLIRWQPNSWLHSFGYSIHFGFNRECFVCGREAVGNRYSQKYGQDIYRPGMRWRQSVCESCELKANRWPRQWPANIQNPRHERGMWLSELPAWPMNVPLHPMAETEVVREWLARRGIVVGLVPPEDCGFIADSGELVHVVGHANGRSIFQYASQNWRQDVYDSVPSEMLRGWPNRRLTA